jgi:hypothetical protein
METNQEKPIRRNALPSETDPAAQKPVIVKERPENQIETDPENDGENNIDALKEILSEERPHKINSIPELIEVFKRRIAAGNMEPIKGYVIDQDGVHESLAFPDGRLVVKRETIVNRNQFN